MKKSLNAAGFLLLFSGILYFFLLGKTGYLEQNRLGKKLENARLEVERLQLENKNLLVKQTLLKKDESILAMEARKYYLLSENAHILKFREAVIEKPRELVKAGSMNLGIFQQNSKEEFPLMMIYRILYHSVSLFAGVWTFFKLL